METIKIIGIAGCMLVASEIANAEIPDLNHLFAEDDVEKRVNKDENIYLTKLRPYLEALYVLPSGGRLINRLDELKDVGLKMVINDTELKSGTLFENVIELSEISDNKVELLLPTCDHGCKVSIPILCKKGDAFCVQDVQVPAYIAVGHELIHFIHKAEAFAKIPKGISSDGKNEYLIKISRWEDYHNNLRAIATIWGYSFIVYDDDGDNGFTTFVMADESSYSSYFEDAWGGTKSYEELRTITGKETNSLSLETKDTFKFNSSELELSERHLLSDFFTTTKTRSPHSLSMGCNPFITRWTHALKVNDVQKESFELVKHLFTDEEIKRLPNYIE